MNPSSLKGPAASDRFELETFFPSHTLVGMREFLEKILALSPLLQGVIRVCWVLDANIVYAELIWRLKKRRDPNAKSSLQEVIESGVLVAIAPTFLRLEIEKHLPQIAVYCRVSIARAHQEWEELQPHLHFYQPHRVTNPDVKCVDTDDLPYKDTCEELGVPVYSKDGDLRAMQVPIVAVPLDFTLRTHARAESVVIGTQLGSGFALILGTEFVTGVCRLIKQVVDLFMKLPLWAQIMIAGTIVVIFAHPKSREKVQNLWRSISSTANAAKPAILGALADVAEQFVSASITASKTCEEIQSALPSPRKQSAIMSARMICLLGKEPLPLAEIERRMRNQGYSTRSKNFPAYLRHLLRASGQFIEVSPDLWTLQGARPAVPLSSGTVGALAGSGDVEKLSA